MIKDLVDKGEMVPSDLVVDLLIEKVDTLSKDRILIEGFPKSLENIESWDRKMRGITHTKVFYYFDVDPATSLKRLTHQAS
jgi:adenylate kinase